MDRFLLASDWGAPFLTNDNKMKLDPGFINHWKTERLIAELGGDGVVAVLRLWGTAQIRREFTGLTLTPRRLAMETKWKGDANHLFSVLTDEDAPWLDKAEDGTYSIHGFGEHQHQVVKLWANGRLGGRPPGKKVSPITSSKKEEDSSSSSCSSSSSYPICEPNGNQMVSEDASTRIPIPFPDEPNGRHTTAVANHLDALAQRVRDLKPAWKLPLTYAEMRSLTECAAALEALEADDWRDIKAYLAAKLPEGSAGWQPKGRSKFLETVTDVYSHAMQWARKNPTTNNHPGGAWK